MNMLPDTFLLPVAQAAPTCHAGATAKLTRQVLPRNAGLEDEQDASQRLNFIVNLMAGVIAYCLAPSKPRLPVTTTAPVL